MKNKKGFTLIELLAVIVILAIIALIATPIVLNMINSARKSAAKSAALGYIDAIEYNNGFATLETDAGVTGYQKIASGDVSTINTKLGSHLKGKAPTSGSVVIDSNGKVTSATLCISGYTVTYENNDVSNVTSGCSSSNNNNNNNNNQEQTVYYYQDSSDKKTQVGANWKYYIKETQEQKIAQSDMYEFTMVNGTTTVHSSDYNFIYSSLEDCQSAAVNGATCVVLHSSGSTYSEIVLQEACLNSTAYGGEMCLKPNDFEVSTKSIKDYFDYNNTTWTNTEYSYAWKNASQTVYCEIRDSGVSCEDSNNNIRAGVSDNGLVYVGAGATGSSGCNINSSEIVFCITE